MGAQPEESSGSRVVLVSDAGDSFVDGFVAALSGAGASVETFGDVYAAIGGLSADPSRSVRMMLVDVRTADRAELRVFEVAHRYFPWVICGAMAALIEPPGSGHEQAGMTAGQAAARFRAVTGTVEAARGSGPPSAAPQVTAKPDSGPEVSGPELKLHDAVRLRMSSDLGTAAVRRMPPRAAPTPVADEATASGAEVTPAELDALLRPDDEHAEGAA